MYAAWTTWTTFAEDDVVLAIATDVPSDSVMMLAAIDVVTVRFFKRKFLQCLRTP